jgi:hypothetical protein
LLKAAQDWPYEATLDGIWLNGDKSTLRVGHVKKLHGQKNKGNKITSCLVHTRKSSTLQKARQSKIDQSIL